MFLRAALVGDVMQLLHYAEAGFGQLWLLGTLARRVPISYRITGLMPCWMIWMGVGHIVLLKFFFSMLPLRGEPHEL